MYTCHNFSNPIILLHCYIISIILNSMKSVFIRSWILNNRDVLYFLWISLFVKYAFYKMRKKGQISLNNCTWCTQNIYYFIRLFWICCDWCFRWLILLLQYSISGSLLIKHSIFRIAVLIKFLIFVLTMFPVHLNIACFTHLELTEDFASLWCVTKENLVTYFWM